MTMIRHTLLFLLVLCMASNAFAEGNLSGNSFRDAKKLLSQQVYRDHRLTFYAGCTYSAKGHVEAHSCGYMPRKNPQRGQRIEWEHIVPAWAFGHALQCWQQASCQSSSGKAYKGRRCCRNCDARFRAMESDMHNLVPAIGELNGDRSNFRYGMISGETRAYGSADFEVDFRLRLAEPAPSIRGDIARTYFYMEKTYRLRISKKQRRIFDIWDREDPVDSWERQRNERIAAIQGNRNPFVR